MSPLRDFQSCEVRGEEVEEFPPVQGLLSSDNEEIFLEDGHKSMFDEIVGAIEDIVVDDKFQTLQSNILEKYYCHFDVRL